MKTPVPGHKNYYLSLFCITLEHQLAQFTPFFDIEAGKAERVVNQNLEQRRIVGLAGTDVNIFAFGDQHMTLAVMGKSSSCFQQVKDNTYMTP